MPRYEEGMDVRYKPVGGPDSQTSVSTGTVMSIATEPTQQAGRNVSASDADPRYEIRNSNTGKTTTVYEKNILGEA
ncbi:predicted protein [Uncinocarpus reesii 1704]|uniref:Hypervirulence associated protein TUDOR domain-containing protein n=1 Tax=Uncinocarpus reesii (strain UAMH 1704) TaxID=336963 RepID=C4JPQ1_UNCRE|nr:uncharacterized protein UREG_03223 [Uncinocarpus reesii 1704]EEP78377.1 predicted protein [Uncinocarpus reesii 1704]